MTTTHQSATCALDSSQVIHVRPEHDRSLSAEAIHDAFRAALAKPLDYPPLASATVPGDHVVLTLQYGTPCPLELVEGALAALRDAGIESSNATLLLSHGFSQEPEFLQEKGKIAQLAASEEIEIVVHDPAKENTTSIVGVTKAGQPLRLNRMLGDADLVLSIGVCSPAPDTDGPCDTFAGLFPVFSDQETIDHYRAPIAADSKVIRSQRQNEINESGWLLGIGLTVQVVPSPSDGIAAVLAGEPRMVAKRASDEYRRIWSQQVDTPGDLVIATLTGDASQQTWENVGRALETAKHVLEPGGALVLSTDLAELPGPSLGRLAGMENSPEVERELMRDRFADSWAALGLSRALARGPVYFRSQLRPEIVESLGMTPLKTEEELLRLVSTSKRCIALEGAQRLLLSVVAGDANGDDL
ncbi:MAG: DUF2088 domain-containing protein [Planctomycetes bacterium]|nr:DUF2088 domain-containing protein [Planctomycetota bacterium]